MGEIIFCPLGLRQRPIRSGPPLVGAHQPVAHRRLVHDAGVLPLQPMVIPADDLVVVLMEWPLQVSRPAKQPLLWRIDIPEVVLCAQPMELVRVGVGSRAGIERYLDFLEGFFGALDGAVELPGMRHHEIHDERALTLLSEDVVEVDVLLVVGIPHRPAPEFLLRGRKFCWPVARLVNRAEDVEQIREGMKNATGVEVAKSEHAAIGAAGMVRKTGLQDQMYLPGRMPGYYK